MNSCNKYKFLYINIQLYKYKQISLVCHYIILLIAYNRQAGL